MRSLSPEHMTTRMPWLGRPAGQGGDDVVGLDRRHLHLGDPEGVDHAMQELDLGRQVRAAWAVDGPCSAA